MTFPDTSLSSDKLCADGGVKIDTKGKKLYLWLIEVSHATELLVTENTLASIDWTITLVKHRSEDNLKFSQCAGRKCTDWKRAKCYRLT